MLVTREMDYAIRILRALSGGERLTSAEIAAREHMQQPMTYKLLKQLVKAKLVMSHRGHVGGYTLGRPCSELTLYDLFTALAGPLFLTACMVPGYSCENNPCGECLVHTEFCRIQSIMDAELMRVPLEAMFPR